MSLEGRPWDRRYVAVNLTIGASLAVAGSALVIILAGRGQVWARLGHAEWLWMLAAPVLVLSSHAGYVLTYTETSRIGKGPDMLGEEAAALVSTGFGPFSLRGGFATDAAAFRNFGLSRRRATLRVRAMGMLEYAVLAPATFGVALFLLVAGRQAQAGVLPSWVIGVPGGTILALSVWLVYRRAGRPASWWSPLRQAFDSMGETLRLLRSWPRNVLVVCGMAIYWASDIGALAVCATVFAGRHRVGLELVVGYATGYALTRRSLPLAGAGTVEALLPFALHWVGYPLATAVLSVVAYRMFNLWLAIVPAIAGLRRMRDRISSGPATRPTRIAGAG